jgi:hypothetical protein
MARNPLIMPRGCHLCRVDGSGDEGRALFTYILYLGTIYKNLSQGYLNGSWNSAVAYRHSLFRFDRLVNG